MRKFITSFLFTVSVFVSGIVFGLGHQEQFTKSAVWVAYNYGYETGRESILIDVINGDTVVAQK
ncbi:hypothetical protein UFOVP353_18 [uncultured Caudovirales phage]|uniref:Uncharacterized protein n=1 Tax=uncultured Caudovirales phage TaxID=2100421 RepID=A0A6J5M2I5_9CAUD|nr:hypothetical protein UFOVP353_18 [uncultured Caudovirales phage]